MKNGALIIAGTIFAVVALIHMSRIIYPFSIVIASYSIPVWFSIIGYMIAGLLASWMFRETH